MDEKELREYPKYSIKDIIIHPFYFEREDKMNEKIERILREFIPLSASYCIPNLIKAIADGLKEDAVPQEPIKIPVTLALTEDLLKELDTRFEHWIFSGMQTAIGGKDKILTLRKWNGNSATCAGLASMIMQAIYDEHRKENELQEDNGII